VRGIEVDGWVLVAAEPDLYPVRARHMLALRPPASVGGIGYPSGDRDMREALSRINVTEQPFRVAQCRANMLGNGLLDQHG
jgi:hypothetical protein